MKRLALAFSVLLIVGCSSAPTVSTPENTPDRVVARIDDLSSRPGWLHESEPFKIESGTVTNLGQTTIPSDHRVEAAYRIAENSAKAGIASAIEQRLEFIFQNAEEGTAIGSTQARYIGAEAAKLTTNSLRPGKRYWEKVATTSDSGNRTTIYRVFSTVSMPESDFKAAIMDAIRRAQGKGGLSADFAKKVDSHWDQFTNANPPAKE
ncbi:MAG TPA: hypothetical protein VJB59_04975 [Bdellovibrionota bacterium]|nr:hypothetical protein [Bdellovibrionota bacterium]